MSVPVLLHKLHESRAEAPAATLHVFEGFPLVLALVRLCRTVR